MDGDAELDSYSLSGGYSFDTTTSTGKDDPAESSFSAGLVRVAGRHTR
jgi:hypothetical protein